jgi:hypothetical protein
LVRYARRSCSGAVRVRVRVRVRGWVRVRVRVTVKVGVARFVDSLRSTVVLRRC